MDSGANNALEAAVSTETDIGVSDGVRLHYCDPWHLWCSCSLEVRSKDDGEKEEERKEVRQESTTSEVCNTRVQVLQSTAYLHWSLQPWVGKLVHTMP